VLATTSTFAALEPCDGNRTLRYIVEDDPVRLDGASIPVVLIALNDDAVSRDPLYKLERPDADRLKREGFSKLFDCRRRNHLTRPVRKIRKQRGVWPREIYRVRVHGLDTLDDALELLAVIRSRRRIENSFEIPLDCLRIKRSAILKCHTLTQPECDDPSRRSYLLRFGQDWNEVPILVRVD